MSSRYTSRSHRTSQPSDLPVACVLGDMDLVRPLAMAGVRTWVVAESGRPPRYSRLVDGVIERADPWKDPQGLVERLVSFASTQPAAPVLFYEDDGYLAVVSRFRRRLGEHFRFVIPHPDLVEDLMDKARFLDLAARLGLPVPTSRRLVPDTDFVVDLDFPVLIKPLTRDDRNEGWITIGGSAKAICVDTPDDLERYIPSFRTAGIPLLAQSLVPGPETAVESYHVYADEGGKVVAEFTGRKIRTLPAEFGFSTALTTTDASDVAELGREIVALLGLSGVAKLDLKRDHDGKLHLLEVNPRFTLWNHLGARAGVNVPGLVYRDLAGLPREEVHAARAGITWCDMPKDIRAAAAASMPMTAWARWAVSADIKTDFAWDDPVPFVRGRLLSRLGKVVRRSLSSRPLTGLRLRP